MTLAAGTRLGPYEILAPLGAGGMGEVYRARDPRLGREVAVKVLPRGATADADRLRRFEQEARAASALNHPNIMAIFDVGTHEGVPYVVSELLEGETLRERVKAGPLPARKAMDWGVQIALGLAAAHDKGIVHRDLKPENVFVTRDGHVKILDFGLAKLTERAGAASADPDGATAAIGSPTPPTSEPGLVLGTAGYMSPEQVRGQPVDHRSDVFSFGTVLYEMLTGHRAFQGGSAVETMTAILKEDPPELSGISLAVPPGFERVVRHCLEKRVEERFQSARDLAFNLQALTGLSGLSGATPGLAVGEGRRWRALAALATGVAVLAGVFIAGRRSAARPAPRFLQLSFGRGALQSARFAPDGQSLVYSAAWSGGPFQLYSARPGSPESRPLGLEHAGLLDVSSTGEMAVSLGHRFRGGFQFSGTLARAPLAGGAPREMLEDVFEAAWAPDGSALAVVRTVAGRDRLEFPVGTVLHETAGWISHMRFSPDGRRIAFLDHPRWPDDAGSVAVVDLDEKGMRPLAAEWASAQGVAWHPSGREVWFTAAESGKARALHAVSLDGRARLVARFPGRLTLQDLSRDGRALLTRDTVRFEIAGRPPGGSAERDLSWLDGSMSQDLSADGRTLLFYEGGEAGGAGYGVYLRGTDGSPAVRLGDGLPMGLSPDGKWVITRPAGNRLTLLPTGPGEPRELSLGRISDYIWAYWFPDGSRVVVNGTEDGHGLRSYVLTLDTGAVEPLTPEGVWGALVSPDGTQLAAVGTGRPVSLCPVGRGGEPRPVAGSRPGDRPAQWSADGRALYVFRRDELPCRLYRLDLTSGAREVVRELIPADPAGVIAVHEVQTTRDGRAYTYSYIRVLSELFLAEGLH